jgi:hypothetical protein
MSIDDLGHKLNLAIGMIEEKGKEYAEARALYNYLYEMKKVMLAACAKDSDGKSNAEKEMLGLTSPEYKSHLHALKEAEGDYLRLEAEYKRWEAEADGCRTLISIEKEKIKNFGG